MTVSYHRYDGLFFPGTGGVDEIGAQAGKYYSLNIPLHEHIDDASYQTVFQATMTQVMESYKPAAVVLQCGADSLAGIQNNLILGDRLGSFNLSIKGHGECVRFMKQYQVPLLVLGGGGYTIRNVARCWAYETAVLTETELPNQLPFNDYLSHFGPDFQLHPPIVENIDNANSQAYLTSITRKVHDYLKFLDGAPSVQMSSIPPSLSFAQDQDEQVINGFILMLGVYGAR
jgi:hypothetical protein